jgi:hypothetical protein
MQVDVKESDAVAAAKVFSLAAAVPPINLWNINQVYMLVFYSRQPTEQHEDQE